MRTANTKDEGASSKRVPNGALCAVFLWGYSMKETARIFGLSTEAVEARLRKALFR